MAAIGALLDVMFYFFVTVTAAGLMIGRVDRKPAVPWASPWRMRAPKLIAGCGPVLFLLCFALVFAGSPSWSVLALFAVSLAAPWIAAILTFVEWFRRRAEDRATGVPRPAPPWT